MSSASVSKSSYQSLLFTRPQCLSKHRSLPPVKQKCAYTSLPNQHSKGGRKQHQSVQFHSNAILQKCQLDSSKQLGHSEKNVKQDLATAKEVAPPKEVECLVKCDSTMGQSSSTFSEYHVIYAGSEHCDPPLPSELWQREKISILSEYSQMHLVAKVSSLDCLRPLQCDEIAPHVRMRVLGDGNCLFCAISRHVTGTESNHYAIRKATVNYLHQNPVLIEYVLAGVDAPLDPNRRKISSTRKYEST